MRLIEPATEYEEQIREYRNEFLASGDSMDGTGALRKFEDPHDWIAYSDSLKDPRTVPRGKVPSTQYMLVREEDGKIVGMIQIRHCFNPYLPCPQTQYSTLTFRCTQISEIPADIFAGRGEDRVPAHGRLDLPAAEDLY